jgi:hypothetical protein
MTNTATLSEVQLRQFTGSENWYRHGINRSVLFTDGAKYVADQGGAYWLLDIIAIAQQHDKRVSAEEFQVWKLSVGKDAKIAVQRSSARTVTTQSSIRSRYRSQIFRWRRSCSTSPTMSSTCPASISWASPRQLSLARAFRVHGRHIPLIH